MSDSADGVLLVGPPFANPIRNSLLPERDPGTPVWDPVFSGTPLEFSRDPADLRAARSPKVVYLQNSSDPIVWFNPRLLYSKPAWSTAGLPSPHHPGRSAADTIRLRQILDAPS